MRNRYLYITLLSLISFNTEGTAQTVAQAPRLVVSILVDQLRTDQLETFAPLYSADGLKRLLTEGTVYTNGAYCFQPVDRASAAAALSTGSTPYFNGIVGHEWLDRQTLRPVRAIATAGNEYAPYQLGTSTLGDELKVATDGIAKVFAFAVDAESAILSAGHAADGVVWMSQGKWQTTRYYEPVNQWLKRYTQLYPPTEEANQSLTTLALACTEQAGIGLDERTDLLSITYHVQSGMEHYMSLDHTIAELIEGITNRIPVNRVLFVLTGTDVTEEEQQSNRQRFKIPTGQFNINRTASLLNIFLGATYGTGQYVEAVYNNQLFLNHKLLERKNINMGEAQRRAQEFLLTISGVRNVYTANQLLTSDNNRLERVRNGFNIEKCGDLLIDIAPGWQFVNEQTHTTTTSSTSNIPFPIIFYGANIKAQRIGSPVTTDHIAPTIARVIRIRAPNACSAEPLF